MLSFCSSFHSDIAVVGVGFSVVAADSAGPR